MSPSKVLSTIAYLINAGITCEAFYAVGKNKGLDDAKAWFDKEGCLYLFIDGKQHVFKLVAVDEAHLEGR